MISRVLDAFRPREATWSGQVISSPPGPSGGPSETHLLPGGGVPRVYRARSPVPLRLPRFAIPQSVHQFAAVAAGAYPPLRPPNACSPGAPAPPRPCYWLVASETPLGWRGHPHQGTRQHTPPHRPDTKPPLPPSTPIQAAMHRVIPTPTHTPLKPNCTHTPPTTPSTAPLTTPTGRHKPTHTQQQTNRCPEGQPDQKHTTHAPRSTHNTRAPRAPAYTTATTARNTHTTKGIPRATATHTDATPTLPPTAHR